MRLKQAHQQAGQRSAVQVPVAYANLLAAQPANAPLTSPGGWRPPAPHPPAAPALQRTPQTPRCPSAAAVQRGRQQERQSFIPQQYAAVQVKLRKAGSLPALLRQCATSGWPRGSPSMAAPTPPHLSIGLVGLGHGHVAVPCLLVGTLDGPEGHSMHSVRLLAGAAHQLVVALAGAVGGGGLQVQPPLLGQRL